MASGLQKKTPTPRLLTREMLKSFTLLPSKFLKEKLLGTKKEASPGKSVLPKIGSFLDKSETRPKLTPAAPKQSLFQVSPPELVFQNVVSHEVSEMTLSLINKDKFPQVVKVTMESSPHFQLMCSNDAYRVVLPGASVPVHVRFTPDENKNYSHKLVCITAREKIVVPIWAIGPQPVLDFPAHLDFSKCPVKSRTQKTLLVHNTGNLETHYQLSTESPFSVVPATGILGAGATVLVTVEFHPLTKGEHSGFLFCKTGEESIRTKLHGEAVNVNIRLSTNSVAADKTFITMSSHKTLFIENKSNITAHFQWKAFPTEEDEKEQERRQHRLLHPPTKVRPEKFKEEKEIEKEKGSFEDHTDLLSSMVQEKMLKLQEDPMLFSSDVFFIEPMEGEIGPNSSAKIKVTFTPQEELGYQNMAYCDITGRESRLPLHFRGEGQGPLLEFSSHNVNLGSLFIDTYHTYEVKLINKGALDAPFIYLPSATNVGSCFNFAPEEGIVAAGGSQTIQISFSALLLGIFEEEFQFSVAGSPMPAILTIRGRVTGPSLEFDADELNFGEISFGFPYTKCVRLTNISPVPLTFKLRMSDDGTQPAVDSLDQIRRDGDPSWRKGIHFYVEPREFTINPSKGTVLPQEYQDIEVTLCSNTVMDFFRRMLVDLEGIGKEVLTLPITARCVVPKLRVYPEILLYDECRLKVPYERKFLVANDTDLPGCYGLIPQKRREDSPVFYYSPKPCGIVQPHSFAEIPVIIEVQALGEHRTRALIGVFGDERNPRRVELRNSGQLEEIYPSPRLIEFGKIPALQPTSRSFMLFNNSPVPVDFRMEVARKPHCCVIEPRKGVIPPRSEVPVSVTATLDDTGFFAVPVQLFIGDSLRSAFGLVALGTGTTVVIDKPFAPELNLGYQFSLVPCNRQFRVTNKGTQFYRLFWSVECHSPAEEEGQSVSALSSPKDDSQSPGRDSPVFGLEPLTMDLKPGQSEDMVLRGFSHIPQVVQDYVMCEAVSGVTVRTEKILETIITCEFIHPSIEVSARQFSFRVNKKPSDVLTMQYQPLTLKNTCLLPLDLMLDWELPFLVCDENQQPLPDGQPVRVDVGETRHLYIAFDPAYELDFKSWKKEKIMTIDMVRGHPFVERIVLRGEVHFPNLQIQPSSLEFGHILAGIEEVRSLEMTNCSPLPVEYRWAFHSKSQVHRLRYELQPPKLQPKPPKERRISLDSSTAQRRRFKIRKEEPVTALKESRDRAQSLGAEVPPESRGHYYIPLGLVGVKTATDVMHTPLDAEEVFSIMPLSGVLQPGESQQVSFTFSSRFNTTSNVTALCHVEGGPTYEVVMTGEISCISYSLSPREINCGSQMFNEIHHSKITLENTSKAEFNWVLNLRPEDQHLPGVFVVNPTTGSIAPGGMQVLEFSYMPGLPGAFSRIYQLKVGDLDPENICLKGEASFPMISINLPWNIKENEDDKPLTPFVKRLQQKNRRNKSAARKRSQSLKTGTLKTRKSKSPIPKTETLSPDVLESGIAANTRRQINMVRTLIGKAALELQRELTSHPPESKFPDKELCQRLVKVELPEYVLDMGTVRKGFTERSTLEITNHGQIPVSFQVDVSALEDTGFSVDLDEVQGLPHSYTKKFDVCFESARQPRGDVDVLLPIEVKKGPTYNIRVRAAVSELSLEVSKTTLHFSAVLVGQYQVETIQLYNWFRVPCRWFIKPVQKNNQHMYTTPAIYQKQQALEDEPCPFEVTPSSGTLGAGRRQNLQIQFAPMEERSYKNELELNIFGSSNNIKLHLSGQGLEPRLEFSPPALRMGWMLVGSDVLEATVVVKNPCNFPIEFYSLDFDEDHTGKEKTAVGYEYQKSIFMPPHAMGETLLPGKMEDHEEQKRPKAQQAELKAEAEPKAKAMGKAAAAYPRTVTFSPEPKVKVTRTPVSRAAMHRLGTAPSSGRREAQQHRGIVVIIHGAPRAGKTETAAGLCQYYDAAYVSIDTVVKETMASDQSLAGLWARELCTKAAMEQKGKKPQHAALSKNKQASGEKMNKNYARGRNPPARMKKEPASKPSIKGTKFTVSTAPAPQQLNIISSRGEELNCLSCVLPEELLVDILSERLKRKDCSKGVIFDGLESLFASSLESSLLCVLKAVKNRRHIYMVNLHQDYASWKAKEEAKIKRKEAEREKEEVQQEKAIQRNTEHIWQMGEDKYDALPKEKKAEVDKILPERQSTQREGELKQPSQKLEEEAKALEEEERQKKEKKGVSLGKQPAKPEKEATAPEKKEDKVLEKRGTKASGKGETKVLEKENKAPGKGKAKIPEDPAEMEKIMNQRFQIYESSQQDIARVFSYWDRIRGTVKLPVIQKGNESQSSAENKGQKTSQPQEKVEKNPEHEQQRSLQSSQLGTQSEAAEGAVRDEHVGVPCLDIQVTDPKAMIEAILGDGKLPTEDQMLEHLGLHPDGPSLSPAAVLSRVEYSEERLGSAERGEPFTLGEDHLAKAPDAKGSSAKGQPKIGKATSRDSTAKERQIFTPRTGSSLDSSATRSRSVLGSVSTPTEFLRLKQCQWIVPAQGEVELKVSVFAKKPGRFEQTLRFELMETKRQYELPCSGTGLYPSISQSPRVVFPQWRATMEENEIIFKEYVESTKQFHFGPLLCGKSREWYKAKNCPGNSENLTIFNNSPVITEVKFFFENPGKAETFFLHPTRMTLKPKEKKELRISAFPTSPGFLEDKLICSIRKNPNPVVFSLCCYGVDIKLEVSPLELSFDKLLLHRTDCRTLILKNNSLLPIAWHLRGLDDVVESFSLSQDKGTIDPHSEFEVTLHFKAGRIGSIEKILRLEVSDTENILGLVQTESIEVSAEVYDVSLGIDMPEGPDGSLEFGTINVLDNVKKVLNLKNKGIYRIDYRFMLKGGGSRMQDLLSYFIVEPQSGMLNASHPDATVEILFQPKSEMVLKNTPILYCQVIDASAGDGGQAVTNIPVRVSAKAEYSKYSLVPASPTDFGAMIKGTKKSRTIVLKNHGTLSFKFCIRQTPKLASTLESKSSKQRQSASSAKKRSAGRKSRSSAQNRLRLGMFTVSPCSGSVPPSGMQLIRVECLAGQEGTWEEQIYIDVIGRDPEDNPLGIPFTLIVESCLPGLVEDVTSIFEAYTICSSANLDRKLQSVKGTGLFVRDENRFIFSKVQAGQEAEAHFRICNACRLPSDVVLSIKPLPGEEQSPIDNIFKLDPVRMSIRGSSSAVATVTFSPPDEQSYGCTFEASLEIPESSVNMKPQTLTFTISGRGQELPVTVVRPNARNKRGIAVLRFRRLQVEDAEILPLVIRNDGMKPLKFMLHVEDEHGAFLLRGRASTFKTFQTGNMEGDFAKNESKSPKQPFFLLRRGQSAEFDVTFKPPLAQRLEGKVLLLVGDSCLILSELVGEGHMDEFTLDGLKEDTLERNAKSSLTKDIIEAVRMNHIQFGYCPVGKRCRRTFTVTNHTRTQVMRFVWEADGPFQFSPKVGHLHPGCAKGITVTLRADVPGTFRRHCVKCKVTKINFRRPRRKVPDWDDQMCIVTWKDIASKDLTAKWFKKERVIEPIPEPPHTEVEKSTQEAEVFLSAVVFYTQFKLSTAMIQFKDTLPFQSRIATFRLSNTGKVALEYSWEEAADSDTVKKQYATTVMRHFLSSETLKRCKKLLHGFGWKQEHPFETHPSGLRLLQQLAKQLHQQKSSEQQQQEQPEQQDNSNKVCRSKRVGSALEIFPDPIHDLALFSIKPYHGIIAPGQKQTFQVRFSPTCAGTFQTTLVCRIPNMKPSQKMRQVIVKGRAFEQNTLDKEEKERPGSQEAGAQETST